MKPLEALGILEQAAAQARLTLQDHALVRQAAEALKAELSKVAEAAPEEKDDKE